MAIGARQQCRLFLEGIEVPFINATITCAPGSPQMASINLVPLGVIKHIRPRTLVHIFVKDTLAFGNSNFYLAFEGEVIGRGYQKAQGSRSFNITAVDYSYYWDEVKAYMTNPAYTAGKLTGNPITDGVLTESKIAAGTGTAGKIEGVSTINHTIIETIIKGKDLVDGVAQVFRMVKDVNLFYRSAFERLKVNERIEVFTGGNIKAFLGQLKAEEFLAAFMGASGGFISVREMLSSVMGLIFHDFITVPFPARIGDAKSFRINQFLFIPDTYSLPPPKCNVIFPNQQIDFNMSEDFRSSPTRMAFKSHAPLNTKNGNEQVAYPAVYFPPSFSNYMHKKPQTTDTSALGPSTLFKTGGKTFANIQYGEKAESAVGGVTSHLVIREADFLTNEESIKGIIFDMETFPQGMTALLRTNKAEDTTPFLSEIGTYMFYKKRFAGRNASATLSFNPFLVPGFNCLLLDDTEAGHSFVAKLQSVTHNLSNDGCITIASLGYARDFDEVDFISNGSGEPPAPKWFDESIFGTRNDSLFKEETNYLKEMKLLTKDEEADRNKITDAVTFPNITQFYNRLLGVHATTDFGTAPSGGVKSGLVSLRGVVNYLYRVYRNKAGSDTARDGFVRSYTRRPIPNMADTMKFLGGRVQGSDEFATLTGTRFQGKGAADESVIKIRRDLILKYANQLKTKRGFRG